MALKSCCPFRFLLWNSLVNLKLIFKQVSKRKFFPLSKTNIYLFLLTKLLLKNAIIRKKPFLGKNCVAGLGIGGKFFGKFSWWRHHQGFFLPIRIHWPFYPTYSIFNKNLNTFVSFFIFKKYFGIFFLILINELCKTINSTHNIKSWK